MITTSGDRRAGEAVEMPGTAQPTGTVVVAAIDYDGSPGVVIAYARERSAQLGIPLRVVHVWTEHAGRRRPWHDCTSDADRLLSDALYDALPPDEADATQRQVLHDRYPARALAALSRQAALLVVAANSDAEQPEARPGRNTRRLMGHTACPLAVVPAGRTAGRHRW